MSQAGPIVMKCVASSAGRAKSMMLRRYLTTLPALIATVAAGEPTRQIAVTIDDLPTVSIVQDTADGGAAMTSKLLASLSTRSIPAIGFVNENKIYIDDVIDESLAGLLQQWLDEGFDLGNHSFSHFDLHRLSLDEFKDDVIRGESFVKPLLQRNGKEMAYFRHPYLHTGESLKIKTELESFLRQNSYRVAPVSIDNSDWIFARAYVLAMRDNQDTVAKNIGQDYVDYMLRVVDFYEGQSQVLFDRNIAHVLLIHANELNADWFGILADELAEIGYQFVSLKDALDDEAYQSEDAYTGPSGISWLHRWALTREVDPAMFKGEPVPPDYILEMTGNP